MRVSQLLNAYSPLYQSQLYVGGPIELPGGCVGVVAGFNSSEFGDVVLVDIETVPVPADSIVVNEYGMSINAIGNVITYQFPEYYPSTPNQKKKGDDMSKKKIMQDFAETESLEDAEEFIKCGFEFEFHAHNGISSSDSGSIDTDAEPDYDLLCEDSSEAWNTLMVTDRLWQFKNHRSVKKLIDECPGINIAEIAKYYAGGYSIGDASRKAGEENLSVEFKRKLEDAFNDAGTSWRDEWESEALSGDPQRYYPEASANYEEDITNWHTISDIAEIGEDATVNGGEIRTQGGLTVSEFLKAASVLGKDNANSWSVDYGCSFHIHLSVDGIEHTYGQRFQAEMYAYILNNWDKLPKSVRDRILSNKGRQYASFSVKNGHKYCAIFKHDQGTWEFRLFGNISKYKSMRKCLEIATEALRHAYQVKLGMVKSLLPDLPTEYITTVFNNGYNNPVDILEQLKKAEAETNVIETVAA